MVELNRNHIAYTESREGATIYRPFITEAPFNISPNQFLIDKLNNGEAVTQRHAFEAYFKKIEIEDPNYMQHIKDIAAGRAQRFPESIESMESRKLQIIVPAYRESENMVKFLNLLKDQMGKDNNNDWGVTFVIDYALPYRNLEENLARKEMMDLIEIFCRDNPFFRKRIDWIFYTKSKDMDVLPVGLARKIGEDVLMYEKLQREKDTKSRRLNFNIRNILHTENKTPFYLGLMDIDVTNLDLDIINQIVAKIPKSNLDRAKIIRINGRFNKENVRENIFLYPLQMWDATISEVGKNTRHNPFTIGRLSAVPARELALTGGSFSGKLRFPDEDIRHGIQIASQVNVETVEVKGEYETSPRREINTVLGIMQLIADNGGIFDAQTLETASLIRMYGNWANETHRGNIGQILNNSAEELLGNSALFNQVVSPKLVEVMVNAFYRFTAFSMFAVDELLKANVYEISDLMNRFLKREISYFEVQLQTLKFIRDTYLTDLNKFNELKPALKQADKKSRKAIIRILRSNNIRFKITDNEPNLGILEVDVGSNSQDPLRDQTPINAPFRILDNQRGFRNLIKRKININDII